MIVEQTKSQDIKPLPILLGHDYRDLRLTEPHAHYLGDVCWCAPTIKHVFGRRLLLHRDPVSEDLVTKQ